MAPPGAGTRCGEYEVLGAISEPFSDHPGASAPSESRCTPDTPPVLPFDHATYAPPSPSRRILGSLSATGPSATFVPAGSQPAEMPPDASRRVAPTSRLRWSPRMI